MKYLIIVSLIFITNNLLSQNVGIGTAAPAEKLDVNGNINVRGNLQVNGNAGKSGQVLKVGSDGSQTWANVFGYKNRVEIYPSSGLTSWTVPNNVREILIEAIGGGGGGAKGGGGGAAGYAVAVVKVLPGATLNFSHGSGGSGAILESDDGSGGGQTSASTSGVTVVADGGGGARASRPGSGGQGQVTGDSVLFSKIFAGGIGNLTTEQYAQYNSTVFVTMRYYGDGGICAYNPLAASKGSFLSYDTNTLLNIKLLYGNTSSSAGAGGGGGNTVFGLWGFEGTSGLIAISW